MMNLQKYEGFMLSHVKYEGGILYLVDDVDKILKRQEALLKELKEDNINISRAYDETLDLYRKQRVKDAITIEKLTKGIFASFVLLVSLGLTYIWVC
jgi:hypothetical protein